MTDLFQPDLGVTFYRSRDPIKNFKIRVCLSRLTSASVMPQVLMEQDLKSSDVEMRDMKLRENLKARQQDKDEYTFQWQQKVFSQREIDLYSKKDDVFDNVLDQMYQADVQRISEIGRPTRRLFSYVDHDDFTQQDEKTSKVTTVVNEKLSSIAQKMATLRHRRVGTARRNDSSDNSIIPKVNLVEYEPSDSLQKQNHLMSTAAVQTMYIMADLSPSNRPATAEDEFVLCTVKIDANGILSLQPDFSKGKQQYKLEASGMGRDIYEYTLEHSSKQLSRQEQNRELKMFKELYNRHAEFLSACVGHDFETPLPDILRVLFYGEINCATNFDCEELYINYLVELPDGWSPCGLQQLTGVTHTCVNKSEQNNDVARFGFPFELEVFFNQDCLNEKRSHNLPKWPHLLVEIQSVDSMQRHRVEGYSSMVLPHSPGMTTHTLQCWRPAGRSCVDELRRFFIGGSPELEDPTYCTVPSTHQGKFISKFGFRTISTGSVTIKLNTIQQSQAFLLSANSRKKVGTLVNRIGESTSQIQMLNILESFQKSKERMIAARTHLKGDLIETLQAVHHNDT